MRIERLAFVLLACAVVLLLALGAIRFMNKDRQEAFFAYGANLGKSTLGSRAGGFINATPASLPGYSLSFASQDSRPAEFGVATLAENKAGKVPGALYYLTAEQMDALDSQSGVPGFYEKRVVNVELPDGSRVGAQAYFLAGGFHLAVPSRPYILAATSGLTEWGYGTSDLDAAIAAAQQG